MHVTRFAPSPTGYLHLGHAYSVLLAEREAATGGTCLLRIEDIDSSRCKPEFTDAIFEDLSWLGLKWPLPVRRQSLHMDDYVEALGKLRSMGVLYPCFCTRSDIEKDASQSSSAPHAQDGTLIYPGTCRGLSERARSELLARNGAASWRLDISKAVRLAGTLFWQDRARGRVELKPNILGDVVLARKDISASYHLCVTVDDHLQGVSLVTRGEDLFNATHVHRLLQELLKLDTPKYFHHPLLTDANGMRYAKRDRSASLRSMREAGEDPAQIRATLLQNR